MKIPIRAIKTLIFILIMIISIQFLFCGVFYPMKTDNFVVKIRFGRNPAPLEDVPPDESQKKSAKIPSFHWIRRRQYKMSSDPMEREMDSSSIDHRLAVIHKETTQMNTTDHISTKIFQKKQVKCLEIPFGLGPISTDLLNMELITKMHENVLNDTAIKSYGCLSQHKATVIVPVPPGFSDLRLNTFLYYIHIFLKKQQLDYQIFVAEQANSTKGFNRGKLINAAFTEVHRRSARNQFHCVIIHDPYILPTDTRNLYRCSWYPRQLATEIETSDGNVYKPTFGGAVAISFEQFLTVNGFSNNIGEKNAEFVDIYHRFLTYNYSVERTPENFGKYIVPKIFDEYTNSLKTTNNTTPSNDMDGLAPLLYDLNMFEIRNMYTYIQISFPEDSTDPSVDVNVQWNEIGSVFDDSPEYESTKIQYDTSVTDFMSKQMQSF